MSKSYARNGTTKRGCVHCYVCHMDKLMDIPYFRDLRLTQDVIGDEITRYFEERIAQQRRASWKDGNVPGVASASRRV